MEGFEPRMAGPEPAALPLATSTANIVYYRKTISWRLLVSVDAI